MRRNVSTAVVAALAALFVVQAWAQSYPNRPVRVVVAAATGGPDIVARIVSAELTNQLGQTFFVENQPGANGIVGANTVFGVLFGFLYWRRGLESAMVAHALAHVIAFTAGRLA